MNNIYLSVFTQGACRRKILRLVHVDPDLEGRRVKIFYGDEGHIILLLLIPLPLYIGCTMRNGGHLKHFRSRLAQA